MVPWWGRGCGSQPRMLGLPLSPHECCARPGHQTLLQNKHTQINMRTTLSLPWFAAPGLSLPVFLSLPFNSRDTATDEARAGAQQCLWQQGPAHFAHSLCQPDPGQTNQELWSAPVFSPTGPAEVPNSSKQSSLV